MSKLIDLTGQRLGKLTVLQRAKEASAKRTYWLCKCDCGNETLVEGGNLRSGHTKSCGHCEKYIAADANTTICLLGNGDTFIFDTEDLPVVQSHKWSIENSGYVHSTVSGKHIRLHQQIMKAPDGMVIDHINGDKKDNRKCNLRIASNMENCRNRGLCTRNTTGFKGVSYDSRRKRYSASIMVNYKNKFLGYYDSPQEAALAYDKAASSYFGEFAKLNYPGKEEEGNAHTEILGMAV